MMYVPGEQVEHSGPLNHKAEVPVLGRDGDGYVLHYDEPPLPPEQRQAQVPSLGPGQCQEPCFCLSLGYFVGL